jgi:hypothetical protein
MENPEKETTHRDVTVRHKHQSGVADWVIAGATIVLTGVAAWALIRIVRSIK